MKWWVPCTLWHIKIWVPLCENGVQIIFFSPLFLDTCKYIEALLNFLSTGKQDHCCGVYLPLSIKGEEIPFPRYPQFFIFR